MRGEGGGRGGELRGRRGGVRPLGGGRRVGRRRVLLTFAVFFDKLLDPVLGERLDFGGLLGRESFVRLVVVVWMLLLLVAQDCRELYDRVVQQ